MIIFLKRLPSAAFFFFRLGGDDKASRQTLPGNTARIRRRHAMATRHHQACPLLQTPGETGAYRHKKNGEKSPFRKNQKPTIKKSLSDKTFTWWWSKGSGIIICLVVVLFSDKA